MTVDINENAKRFDVDNLAWIALPSHKISDSLAANAAATKVLWHFAVPPLRLRRTG
jgi:hypothetical protein